MAKKTLGLKAPDSRPRWTMKQIAFCYWYTSAECYGNGTESARRAGYAGSENTLAAIAYENLRKPQIAEEIKRLEEKAIAAANVTIEKVLRDVELQRQMALNAGQLAPAVKCSELQGKYLKMWVEKIEHVQTIEDVGTPELARMLRELAEVAGIDLVGLLTGDGSEDSLLPGSAGAPKTH